MALVACIGRVVLQCEVGPGNTHAVITAWIHHHVGGFRHVAFKAVGAGRVCLVAMVFLRSEF